MLGEGGPAAKEVDQGGVREVVVVVECGRCGEKGGGGEVCHGV